MTTSCPHTRRSLQEDLLAAGILPGQTLLLHASLRSLGYVCGGVAVVQAHRDPSSSTNPAIPPAWWPTIRAHLPAFDPALTPSRHMGVLAETIRTWPGAVRTGHPQTSFAAVGRHAARLMAKHDLDSELGEASPLRALEEAGGLVLLLGVAYDKCTAFHLAEYRLPTRHVKEKACVMLTAAGRQWVTNLGVDLDASPFGILGLELERKTQIVSTGRIGSATARLFPIKESVVFALDWLRQHREGLSGIEPSGAPGAR